MGFSSAEFIALVFLSVIPQVLCFRPLRKEQSECVAHTQTHTNTEGRLLLPSQTSKLAVPWETSNAGEAIKRQKLFSVRSWFIWLKNETTNPTDIIFPSQGLLYQAQLKLLPGGNPLIEQKGLAWKPEAFSFALVLHPPLWLHVSFLLYCYGSSGYLSFMNNYESTSLPLSPFVWFNVSEVHSQTLQDSQTVPHDTQ